MTPIGGNITAQLQVKTTAQNAIGEAVPTWETRHMLTGFLDLANGNARYTAYDAKMQESTHYFLCDYIELPGVTAENARLQINGKTYDVLAIDDPMGLHAHLEIYLKYTGGQ